MTPVSMIRRLVCVSLLFVTALGRSSGGTTLAATQRRAPPIVYVALGDGYTTGDDGSGPVAASYPALLARHFPKGSHYRNLASAEDGASNALYFDLPATLAAHPTLVTVWFGALDLTYGGNTLPALFGKDMDTLLTALQRTHARVFVANMPDFRLFKDPASMPHVKNGLAFNAIIAAEARRHGAVLVDVYAATKTVWGHPDLVGGYSIPTAKGQLVLAALFYGVMHSHGAL